jgi:hypothetical protein
MLKKSDKFGIFKNKNPFYDLFPTHPPPPKRKLWIKTKIIIWYWVLYDIFFLFSNWKREVGRDRRRRPGLKVVIIILFWKRGNKKNNK